MKAWIEKRVRVWRLKKMQKWAEMYGLTVVVMVERGGDWYIRDSRGALHKLPKVGGK